MPWNVMVWIVVLASLSGGFFASFLYAANVIGLPPFIAFAATVLGWMIAAVGGGWLMRRWGKKLRAKAEEGADAIAKRGLPTPEQVTEEMVWIHRKVVWKKLLIVGAAFYAFWWLYALIFEPLPAETKIMIFQIAFQMGIGLFFIPMNFMMLYGPFLLMAIIQIKFLKPGSAKMRVKMSDVRGQKVAVGELKMILEELIDPQGDPPRGVLLIGPPGVGKTMFATAAAASMSAPIVVAPASAFIATFLGVDILTVLFVRWMTGRYLKVYPFVFIFIDEIDIIGFRRGGLVSSKQPHNLAEALRYGAGGAVTSCGLSPDYPSYRAAAGWQQSEQKFVEKYGARVQPQFPGGFAMMGPMAIYAFLTWMDGMETPPWLPTLIRSQINALLDALFIIPVKISGKWLQPVNWFMDVLGAPQSLRVPLFGWRVPLRAADVIRLRLPAVPVKRPRILFMGATNRPSVLDPALTRAGRFEEHVHFVMPGAVEREDVLDFYLAHYAPTLNTPEFRKMLARAFVGFSPADIMHICRKAKHYRSRNRKRLLRGEITEAEAGFAKSDPNVPTWQDFTDAMSAIMFGLKRIDLTSERQKEKTAGHEAGHFIAMKYFSRDVQASGKIEQKTLIPTHLSCIPRGDSYGRLAWVPEDERDPEFQEHLAAELRISLASYAAERLLYGSTGPGVGGDFMMAATQAAYMAGVCGMGPYRCEKEEEARFYDIGNYLVAVASVAENPLLEKVYGRDRMKKRNDAGYRACVLLGQAYADSYRMLAKNIEVLRRVAATLTEREELVGKDLEEFYESLELVPPLPTDPLPEMQADSPFYGDAA